jgi:hypothetical protein
MKNIPLLLFLLPLNIMAQIDLTTKNNIEALEKKYPWYYVDGGSAIILDFTTTFHGSKSSSYGNEKNGLYLFVFSQGTAFVAENHTLDLDNGSFYVIEVVDPTGKKTELSGKCIDNYYTINVYNPEILTDILSSFNYITINLKTKSYTMSSVVPCKYFKRP